MLKRYMTISAVVAAVGGSAYFFVNKFGDKDEQLTVENTVAPVKVEEKQSPEHVDINEKKRLFFNTLRPGVELENQRIVNERERLLAMKEAIEEGASLSAEQRQTARRLGKLYNAELGDTVTISWLNTMLSRVNVLPEALVLTQAANESAWGTSRFAVEANNYFGQWCYKEGCGLVPLKRTHGMTHEVATFPSAQGSIHGYFMNVNRNRAYAELREIRDTFAGKQIDATSPQAATLLTSGLMRYSERGEAYVKDLQAMIRHNQAFWTHNK
jgi:Bax protein